MVEPDSAVLTTAFDTFVAILVQFGEVFPQFFISRMYDIAIFDGGELRQKSSKSSDVKFVLVSL